MASDEILIRDINDDDESYILKLFSEVFEHSRGPEHWRWQYKKNPHGKSWITIAELNSQIVGHAGLVRINLNLKGEKILGALACDAMIKPDQQGAGLYTNMSKFNHNSAFNGGVKGIVAFVSRNPYPASYTLALKYLNSNRIGNLKRFFYRIGFQAPLTKQIDKIFKSGYHLFSYFRSKLELRRIIKDISIETTSKLPDDLGRGLKNIIDFEVLSVWKDEQYLKWRYENHPQNNYKFHILRNKGIFEGLVVTRDCGYSIAICDILHTKKNIFRSAILLKSVVRYWCKSPAQIIEFYGYDNGFFDAVFDAAKFKIQPFSPLIFIGKVHKNQTLNELFFSPQNWSIAYGDGDLI